MDYKTFVSELQALSKTEGGGEAPPLEKAAYEQLQFDLPDIPVLQLLALKAKISEGSPLAAMKAFPLTQPYVKHVQNAQSNGAYSYLCAQTLVVQLLALLSATHEERDALLAAYVPEDQSEPPKEGAPAAADDTDDVYLDMNEDAAPDYHARTPPSRTWSAAEKLADLATHASYAVLSRGSTWDELRLDDVGPALYASLAKHSHASASLHWLGVLTERLLECPQSVPALLPSVTAVLQMTDVSHVEVVIAAMSSLAHRVNRTPTLETFAATQPFLAKFTTNTLQGEITPEHIADFSHVLRSCAFAAQSKAAHELLLKSGLLRDTVMFFLRTQRRADAFIFHDQLLHVCCASATFRDFVLRVPEVVEAVSAADVKASESVVWHALLSLIAEEEPTAARFYEASCAKLSAMCAPPLAAPVNWADVKRTLQLFSTLQRSNHNDWRWRVLVNRWHPMGDATLLTLLMRINDAAKARMTEARVKEEKESIDKPDTSVKKELKILNTVAALLKTLYGDESRGAKND